MRIAIADTPIDVNAEVGALTRGRGDAGALVTFSGICRSKEDGEAITALVLEHYPGMAEAEIERHIVKAKARWPLLDACVVHRVGRITPGETIVLVATIATHRQAAFAAAEFLMDYLKTRAPFWKKAEAADGTHWIEAHARDADAAARWQNKHAAE